jgi:hypothetical protein
MPADLDAVSAGPARTIRLLGPFDLYLQLKDRVTLVDDPAKQKVLWPVLGRPGAVLVDGEIAGTWRRAQAKLTIEPWRRLTQAERSVVEAEAQSLPLPEIEGQIVVSWIV